MLPKVLFIIDSLRMGGAEKSTLEIARRMTGFIPVICQLHKPDDVLPQYQSFGIQVIQMNLTPKTNFFSIAAKVKEVVRAVDPLIVHAALFRSEISSRMALWNNKNTVLIGSLVGDTYNRERFRALSLPAKMKLYLLKILDAYTSKRVDAFISISQFLKDSYVAKLRINPSKIFIIPRGREISENSDNEPATDGKFIFLNVGRLIPLKGHTEMIMAVKGVCEKFPNVILKIAGEGPLRNKLTSLIKARALENMVHLLGNVNNVGELLRECNVFIFASHHEGQGGALVEAMLAGKPIIASDIPVVREAINDGETGILFSVKNAESLEAKMIYAINSFEKLKAVGMQAKKIASERYNIDTLVSKQEQLYRKFLMR
jgi:glycosyltransferase involved in cell wall biosynthesis